MSTAPSSQVKGAIYSLAYFEPTCQDNYGNQILDYLVLDALSGYGMIPVNLKDIKNHIKTNFKLDFELEEIIIAAERLSKKNFIEIIKGKSRFDTIKIVIRVEASEHINNNLSSINNLEKTVYYEWKEELQSKYKILNLGEANLDIFIDQFKIFLSKLLVRHGIESVNILYPDVKKVQEWLNNVQSSILSDLPNLGAELNLILQIEIPLFFQSTNISRKQYISNLFNASFIWHLTQIDKECEHLIRDVTKGQILIIDNNVLFSLIGFSGEDVLGSVHNALKIAGELGYELLVTTKTLDEFQQALLHKIKEFNDKPPIPKNLSEVVKKVLKADHFLSSYWSEYAKSNISINEFILQKSYIEDLLKGLNIGTSNKFRKEIEESEELKDEESILRNACGDDINANIVSHDAFHKIYVSKLRKGSKTRFSEANAWFLTHDSKLPKYARASNKGQKHLLPFCITFNQWVQINRPLIARTENYAEFEDSFTNLVTQPYLRTLLSGFSVQHIQEKLLSRLARYSNLSPEIAFNLATDIHFMTSVNQDESDENVDNKIENKLIDLNAVLKQNYAELETEYIKLKTEAGSDKKIIEELNSQMICSQAQINDLFTAVETLKNSEQNATELAKSVQEALDFNNVKMKEELESAITNNRRLKEENELLKLKVIEDYIKTEVRKWQRPGFVSLCLAIGLVCMFSLAFIFQSHHLNIAFRLIDNIDAIKSDLIKNWTVGAITSILLFIYTVVFYNYIARLFSRKKISEFKNNIKIPEKMV